MRRLRREGNFPGNSPHQGDQCSRKRHRDLIGILAASHELSIPFAQPDLRLPPEVLDGFGPLLQSQLEMATDRSRMAVRPRALNQGPAGVMMPGLGDTPLGAPWATGLLRGRQARITPQLFGVGKASEVSEFGDGRDRHRELGTPQSLEGPDHWG
jgi:hypothetical protein